VEEGVGAGFQPRGLDEAAAEEMLIEAKACRKRDTGRPGTPCEVQNFLINSDKLLHEDG
jgi:hypothetical protein